ncbi:hypothetical protein DDZ14_07600 [Maritimibacter sp. 55A14]|nr:hypothetical protein DDZ14_07600 [Maritimibacter sp. 55A14]
MNGLNRQVQGRLTQLEPNGPAARFEMRRRSACNGRVSSANAASWYGVAHGAFSRISDGARGSDPGDEDMAAKPCGGSAPPSIAVSMISGRDDRILHGRRQEPGQLSRAGMR